MYIQSISVCKPLKIKNIQLGGDIRLSNRNNFQNKEKNVWVYS